MHLPTLSAEPSTISAVIREGVASHLGHHCDWRRLAVTGTSNRLYWATHEGEALVLRVNADPAWAFGVDRAREARVLQSIAGCPWAPAILRNHPEQGWCLMRAYQPMTCDLLNEDDRAQLLLAVQQWQQLPGKTPFDYRVLYRRYGAVLGALAGDNERLAALLMRLRAQVFEGLDQLPPVPTCLVHHDLHAGNLCRDNEQLIVLDWEYAGLGSPWLDAAPMLDQLECEIDQLMTLPAFEALSRTRFIQGWHRARRVQRGLELLWYWVREQNGQVEARALLEQRTERFLLS